MLRCSPWGSSAVCGASRPVLTASPTPASEPQSPPPPPPPRPGYKTATTSDAESSSSSSRARSAGREAPAKASPAHARTMTSESLTHDVQIQTIDESKREFRPHQGTEFNFRDSWMLQRRRLQDRSADRPGPRPASASSGRLQRRRRRLHLVGRRRADGRSRSRYKKKISRRPDARHAGTSRCSCCRLFDQLIANIDRNLGNLLISNDWTIWAIDHTRAFRTNATLKTPGNVDALRSAGLRAAEAARQADDQARPSASSLQSYEIDAVLKRRDAIVAIIEQKGETRCSTASSSRAERCDGDCRSSHHSSLVRPGAVNSGRSGGHACRIRAPPAMLLSFIRSWSMYRRTPSTVARHLCRDRLRTHPGRLGAGTG